MQADMHVNIDYMAPHGAPDNDRKMKEASWLTGQAFIESLRYYPKGTTALENNDCEATYSGCTHSARQVRLLRMSVELGPWRVVGSAWPVWRVVGGA